MSLSSDYASILNELNRDVIRHLPHDPLQFCSDWFHNRLREDRRLTAASSSAKASFSGAPLPGSVPSSSAAAGAASSRAVPSISMSTSDTAMPFANSNPFGTAPTVDIHPASRNGSITGSDTTEGDMAPASAFVPPSNFHMGRRTSVSAESLNPTSPVSMPSSEVMSKTVIPKTESQMQRIRASIQNNLLFRNLDEEQERDVLLAMKEVKCEANSIIIRQGDQGDFFYVVESGALDVYIKSSPDVDAGPAGRGSVGSIYSTDSEGPATTHMGTSVVPGSNLSSELGEHKLSYGPSDAFGELSLLYLTPRAASIVSTAPCLLWALDRVTFRSILMETNSRKKLQLEKFLRDVPLFDTLDSSSISKLADALQFREYNNGDRIIQQGERGTEFFIILDGMVSVRKQRDASASEEECGTLVTGEYFGELALLNGSARAASIVAISSSSTTSSSKVKMAVLSEQAFKRMVGSLASTMELHASTHYYNLPSVPAVSQSLASAGAAGSGQIAGFAASASGDVQDPMVGPHDTSSSTGSRGVEPGMGRWVGGLGSSPFGMSSQPTAADSPRS
jgi:cAMP-dependent protein kinase regulator